MAYQPKFTITPRILTLVEDIAALRERIAGATVQVPWIPARAEGHPRAQRAFLDGDRGQSADARAGARGRGGRDLPVPDRARREVVNYFAALRYVEKQAAEETDHA